MNRVLRLAAVTASIVSLAACGGDGATDETSGSASEPVAETPGDSGAGGGDVEIKATQKLTFDPATLTATVGTAFNGKLVQVGSIPHNIELDEFDVKGGDTMVTKDGESKSFSFTPDKAGTFTYVCTIHPATMKGTLTVS